MSSTSFPSLTSSQKKSEVASLPNMSSEKSVHEYQDGELIENTKKLIRELHEDFSWVYTDALRSQNRSDLTLYDLEGRERPNTESMQKAQKLMQRFKELQEKKHRDFSLLGPSFNPRLTYEAIKYSLALQQDPKSMQQLDAYVAEVKKRFPPLLGIKKGDEISNGRLEIELFDLNYSQAKEKAKKVPEDLIKLPLAELSDAAENSYNGKWSTKVKKWLEFIFFNRRCCEPTKPSPRATSARQP